ncbi:NERD domain-containing protein [Cryobacterium sp. TMT1-3]|uniref:nuclease-related domain-containing protein n=1 Tax=Cryobacterium sp. TMT1-3 TaxID=1259237 RepID=UPI00106A4A18|nr:nuclease-related domain-containing protein [Cryobacterium sp. TMT1-3]TFC28766.1 NERD domain-containing protein [Cryobacterium sp. TMT1-3]
MAITILGAGVPARDSEPARSAVPFIPTAPGRFAGQSVVEELLRQHGDRPQRSRLARTLGASPLDANELSWLRAAQAEMIVGDILARLPEGYSVYHSLPIRHTAFWVDHLVVGPGGIFSINSKTHWDRDLTGSQRSIPIGEHAMPYLRDARFESAQITALLAKAMPATSVVQPVIVLVNPHKILLARKPDTVTVIDSPRLRRWLVGRPQVFSAEQQAALTTLVDDPGTWRAAGQPLAPAHLHARFTALEQQVAAARTRRTTFTVLAAAAAATVLALATAPLIVTAVEYLAAR